MIVTAGGRPVGWVVATLEVNWRVGGLSLVPTSRQEIDRDERTNQKPQPRLAVSPSTGSPFPLTKNTHKRVAGQLEPGVPHCIAGARADVPI